MNNLIFYLTLAFFIFFIVKNIFFWTYLWQLKEYRLDRLLVHLRSTQQGRSLIFGWFSIAKLVAVLFFFASIFSPNIYSIFPYIVFLIYLGSFLKVLNETRTKKLKLPVPTLKSSAIFALTAVITIGLVGIPLLDKFLWLIVIEKISTLLIVLWVGLLWLPSDFYKDIVINRAIKRLSNSKKLLTIGITGSYGKGSTKNYLSTILSYKFNVLETYGNYNTPIGIAKTVLKGITDKKNIFIAEMGAYKKGEISEMSSMVKPKIGILTGINDQHISLFGNQENIIEAKYELIDSLPKDGLGLFNGNSKYCLDLYKKTKKKKILYYVDYDNKRNVAADITADNIKADKLFTSFSVKTENKKLGNFTLKLIGKHSIENVLPGIYLASYLGMETQAIKKSISKISPTKKTVYPYVNVKKTILIDDTYNANPKAVEAVLEYMKLYKGKKVLILQPMIELGKNSNKDHYEIAKKIAEVCNYLFLTNDNYVEAVKKGIKESGGNCKVILDIPNKTASFIQENLGRNDVVVFEGKEAGIPLSLISHEEV
ncbi:UDP-N-acetylmuramoyl-tripeptide--D-alanyl-D-alanine ligase [Candidatus Parcubacteria bacterium]|nr:MAG: UDP-N-acetylmuramoyl-tripeptide--D-alanyl-D-alanine ligase [Candidatus Parcubacteria bacterium]